MVVSVCYYKLPNPIHCNASQAIEFALTVSVGAEFFGEDSVGIKDLEKTEMVLFYIYNM